MTIARRLLLILLFTLYPMVCLSQLPAVRFIPELDVSGQFPDSLISMLNSDPVMAQSRIEQSLAGEGYLDADVDSVIYADEEMLVYISEGCRYSLGNLSVSPEDQTRWPDYLPFFRESGFTGQYFTQNLIRDIPAEWLTAFEEAGYLLAEFRIKVIRKLPDCTVEIQATVMEGERILLSGILFDGVQRNDPAYLRRVAGIRTGETVTPALMNQGRRNLINSGLFDDVSSGELVFVDDDPHILYEVTEQQLNFFDGLIGYVPDATGSGNLAGYGDILLRNSIANGFILDLRYEQLQPLVSKLNLEADQHYPAGLPVRLGAALHFTQQDSSYLVRNIELRGGYRLFSGIELIGTARVERSISADDQSTAGAIDSRANFYGLGFYLRNTDRYSVPTRGYESRVMLERGRRFIDSSGFEDIGESSFGQTLLRTMVRGYLPVGVRQVLAPRVQAMHLESRHFLVTDLFRFGGAESLRGFREDQFRASSVVWGDLEARYLIDRDSYLFIFGAYGLYERPQLLGESTDQLERSEQLVSTGFGLAFQSPLGLIKFSYAVSPNENLSNGNVHVGITAGL